MTALYAVLVALGMALVGARVVLALLIFVAGAIFVRTLPEENWDGSMLLFTQMTAAIATFLVGYILVELPWYAAVPAALFVGVTTYAKRAPEFSDY